MIENKNARTSLQRMFDAASILTIIDENPLELYLNDMVQEIVRSSLRPEIKPGHMYKVTIEIQEYKYGGVDDENE